MSGATVAKARRTNGVTLGPTTLSAIGATGVPILATRPIGQARPPAEATRATAERRVRTCATHRQAASLTRPRPSRPSRWAAAVTATAPAQVSAARRTVMPRAGTAVTDGTPGTAPATTHTRVPATDVTPAALMAAMASLATGLAVKETTQASVAALATPVPMAGPVAQALPLNTLPSIMMTRMTTPRRARPGHTGGFPSIHCMTIRPVNSTGWLSAPRKVFARQSLTLLSMSSTWCPRRRCSESSTKSTGIVARSSATSGSRIFGSSPRTAPRVFSRRTSSTCD